MNSKEYQELRKRLDELKKHFIDFEIPIDREPTPAEIDKIAAFKLLMHAELETFVEDRILRAIDESIARWVDKKEINRCLLNLVLRWSEPHTDENQFQYIQDNEHLDELVKRCAKRARDEVQKNNSIKQDAFLRMCCSAGFISQDLDNTLLAELESFGKTRGDVAHRGAGKVRILNAPDVEAQLAENIVTLLARFDLDLASVVPSLS